MYDLSVSWIPVGGPVDGYRVYDHGTLIADQAATTLILPGYLSVLGSVSIQVAAYNAAGEGAKSEAVVPDEPTVGLPSQVQGVTVGLLVGQQPEPGSSSSWIGIPDPTPTMGYNPFTVTESADPGNWPTAEDSGNYYIDPSHVSATDTANTYGYPDKPRATIPSTISLATAGGKCVFVGDGASYSANDGDEVDITGNGTVSDLNWVVGRYTTTPPEIDNVRFITTSDYTVHEYYHIKDFSRSQQCFRQNGTKTTVRHVDFGGTGTDVGNSAAITCGDDDNVFWDVTGHDFGDWQGASENDYHLFKVGTGGGRNNLWLLEFNGSFLGGDTIQLGDATGSSGKPNHIYIGGGVSHSNLENAVDIKNAEDIIISGVECYNMFGGPGSDGTGITIHNSNSRVWAIGCKVYDCNHGIKITGGTEGACLFNEVRDCATEAFTIRGTPDNSWVYDSNTLHGNKSHFDMDDPCIITNNMMGDLEPGSSGYQVWFSSSGNSDNSTVEGNFYSTAMRNRRNSIIYTDIASWRSGSGHDADGIEAAPLFVNENNNDFTLQAGSSAVDAGSKSSIYATFEGYYGISIEVDRDNNPRPAAGGDWDMGAYERQ